MVATASTALTQSNADPTTRTSWKVKFVPSLTGFSTIGVNVTTLGEHIGTSFAALVCSRIVGMGNHTETRWKGNHFWSITLVPPIVRTGRQAVHASACLSTITIVRHLINGWVLMMIVM